MINKEKDYVSTKVNAGAKQENIKFPKKYRRLINSKILRLLDAKEDSINILEKLHSNSFFTKSEPGR